MTTRRPTITPTAADIEPTAGADRPLPAAIRALGLTHDEVEAIGREFDQIRADVLEVRGDEDAAYIRRVVKVQRITEGAGRGLLFLGFLPPMWLAGTAALAVSKILDNMEIGHNVMHGQYDWMGDPALDSTTFQWDSASPASTWKHSHNYLHHTWTNILGKDRDIGYGILRMSEEQAWRPYYLGNPVYAFLLATFFQYGVALHDLETERLMSGDKELDDDLKQMAAVIGRNVGRQSLKDYVLWPALTGPLFLSTMAANAVANWARNVWAFTIIFCGHFPDDVEVFTEEECVDESRGQWYVRQLLGSANITGGKLFHVMSGNLSHQIEHHLFPDLPSYRYAEIAPRVREICERYGLPYTTGRLSRQFGQVVRSIVRLAVPDRLTRRGSEAAAPA
jgi:NADPH-dependent stearoyl-CoA 9-desaturase